MKTGARGGFRSGFRRRRTAGRRSWRLCGGLSSCWAEYEGTISSLENPEERLPFTVQFIRTELNDYYRIRCTELARSFWGPTLVKDPEDPKTSGSEWAFAQSDIYSYAVQEVDGALVFTHGCRFPEALPDRIRVHWYNPEAYALSEDSVAERTDR